MNSLVSITTLVLSCTAVLGKEIKAVEFKTADNQVAISQKETFSEIISVDAAPLPVLNTRIKPLPAKLIKVGEFRTYSHQVAGTVYARNERTLVVKEFTYDGKGPDAFFWVGTQGTKPSLLGTILPHPFNGKFYEYEDQSAPILSGRFKGDTDIVLTLPDSIKVTDIKWMSVWCRRFSVPFGDFTFPVHLSLDAAAAPEATPESEPETEPFPDNGYDEDKKEELPPPALIPVDNDISNIHNRPGDHNDADAYPEVTHPKTEPENNITRIVNNAPSGHLDAVIIFGNVGIIMSGVAPSLLITIFVLTQMVL